MSPHREPGAPEHAWIDAAAILISEAVIHRCETACVPVDTVRDLVRVARAAVAFDRSLMAGGIDSLATQIEAIRLRRALARKVRL